MENFQRERGGVPNENSTQFDNFIKKKTEQEDEKSTLDKIDEAKRKAEEQGDENFLHSKNLKDMIQNLRKSYFDAVVKGEVDRVGFEGLLNEIETHFLDVEVRLHSKNEDLSNELKSHKALKEEKLSLWIDRYERLQAKWNDLNLQFQKLQQDKEMVRKQRDLLITATPSNPLPQQKTSSKENNQNGSNVLRTILSPGKIENIQVPTLQEDETPFSERGHYNQIENTPSTSSGMMTARTEEQKTLFQKYKEFSNKRMIPPEIEEYIQNLSQCWKKAVQEATDWQKKATDVEEDLMHTKNKVFAVERTLNEKEQKIIELREKLAKLAKDQIIEKGEWSKERETLKRRIKELKSVRIHSNSNNENNENAFLNDFTDDDNNDTDSHRVEKEKISQEKDITLVPIYAKTPRISDSNAKTNKNGEKPLVLPDIASKNRNSQQKNQFSNQIFNQITQSFQNFQTNNAPVAAGAYTTPRGNGNSTSLPNTPPAVDLYFEVIKKAPCSILILTKNYRIWRVNQKFCELLQITENDILGFLLSEICLVDEQTIPKLLEFDLIQGLGIHPPKMDKRQNFMSSLTDNSNNSNANDLAGTANLSENNSNPKGYNVNSATIGSATNPRSKHIVYKTKETNFLRANVMISKIDGFEQFKVGKKFKTGPFYCLMFTTTNKQS